MIDFISLPILYHQITNILSNVGLQVSYIPTYLTIYMTSYVAYLFALKLGPWLEEVEVYFLAVLHRRQYLLNVFDASSPATGLQIRLN